MTEEEIRERVDRFEDEQALAELKACGEQALPAVRAAFSELEPSDTVTPDWLVRILEAVAGDFLGEALLLLPGLAYLPAVTLGWSLHRKASPADRSRLRETLACATGFAGGGEEAALPDDFGFFGRMPAAAVLCEVMAGLGDQESRPILRNLYDRGHRELLALKEKGGSFYEMFYRDYAPAVAAAAAALLSLEHQAGRDHADLKRWRQTCCWLARDKAIAYGGRSTSPPMSFLFAGSEKEAARVGVLLLGQCEDLDQPLRHMGWWISEAAQHGVEVRFDPSVEGVPELLRRLAEFVEELPYAMPHEYANAAAPLQVMSAASPESASQKALELLRDAPVGTDFVADAVAQLSRLTELRSRAAICVEGLFCNRLNRNQPSTLQSREEEALNRDLAAAGLSPVAGWGWEAPGGSWGALDTVEGLNEHLCAVSGCFARFGGIPPAKEASELLKPLLESGCHQLVSHAVYRNALIAFSRAPPAGKEALSEFLEERVGAERSPTMAKAVLTIGAEVLRDEAAFLHAAFLRSPAVRADPLLAGEVVAHAKNAPDPATRNALAAFKSEIEKGRGGEEDELLAAVREALLALGEPDEIRVLSEKICKGRSVSAFEEMALLRLSALQPGSVETAVYRKLLERVLSGGYGAYSGWIEAIMCPELHAYLVERVSDPNAGSEEIRSIATFIRDAGFGKAPLPSRALPPLLSRLPDAVEAARTNPGKEWEDRNWGGYNQTPQEDLAEALSNAVVTLAKAEYSREQWKALLQELAPLAGFDLEGALLAVATTSGFSYKTEDLVALLGENLLGLRDPAVRAAMGKKLCRDSFPAVIAALSRNSLAGGRAKDG